MENAYQENLGLVYMMARRYAWVCKVDNAISPEDLLQLGALAVLQAANAYDQDAGKSWSSWAVWFIQNEYRAALGLKDGQVHKAHAGAIELDAPLSADDAGGAALVDLLSDDSLPEIDAGLVAEDVKQTVRAAVERLQDAGQRGVIRLHRLEGKTLTEAAEALQMDEKTARKLDKAARRRLEHDPQLRALVWLEDNTRYYAYKGPSAFQRDLTSVTEAAAMWRIQQRKEMDRNKAPSPV